MMCAAQACLVIGGFQVTSLPASLSTLVRHRGLWVENLKAELLSGAVTRVVHPQFSEEAQVVLQFYEAIGLLASSGVLTVPSMATVEFHEDSTQFSIPEDLQVPLSTFPLSWQALSGGRRGAWPKRFYDASDALRLAAGAVPRAAARLLQTCTSAQYVSGGSCLDCTVCNSSEVLVNACTSSANTVCRRKELLLPCFLVSPMSCKACCRVCSHHVHLQRVILLHWHWNAVCALHSMHSHASSAITMHTHI